MNTLTDLVEHAWHQFRTVEQLDVGFEEIPTPKKMAHWIDHTQLKPTATRDNIRDLCEQAKTHQFASVCVHPVWVADCAEWLRESGVPVCTVAGFPLGANTAKIKAEETRVAVSDGAREIDMVINIGRLKERNYTAVFDDIRAVVDAADDHCVKVIIEACLLTEKDKVAACALCKEAGAAFVKTSTGFSEHGATTSDVNLMRRVVGKDLGVKAAGGIRDYYTAVEMIRAGASRIGASASVAIVTSDV